MQGKVNKNFKEARHTKQCLEPVKLVSRLPTYNGIVAASRESIYFFIVIVINIYHSIKNFKKRFY